MSRGDRFAARPCMSGFLRAPERKSASCLAMYSAFWPASLGLGWPGIPWPVGPWQAAQAADLVLPAAMLPAACTGLTNRAAETSINSQNRGNQGDLFMVGSRDLWI